MRVRILKTIAGPNVQLNPGQVVELDDTTAQAYIEAEAAVSLDPVTVHVDSEPAPKSKRKKATEDAAGSTAQQPDEKETDESAGDSPAAS